jgi:hypothetical protein
MAGSNAANVDKKAKKRKSKSMKKQASAAPAGDNVVSKPKRDFQADLKEYLESWKSRDSGSDWKFNKVLQSWAVMHSLERNIIDKELFKMLCPYLATIMGVQRDRFLEAIEAVIDLGAEGAAAEAEEEGDEEAAAAAKPCYNRAVKLRTIMEE